jgi:NAD(P)H-hydrate epimerase
MKILSAERIQELDRYTIENEPIASIDLMERAAQRCAERIQKVVDPKVPVRVLAGVGNNGGDGLVIARLLKKEGYNVAVQVVRVSQKTSEDHAFNAERWKELGEELYDIRQEEEIPSFGAGEVVIDAMFGTGLSRPLEGIAAEVVKVLNKSEASVIAVDSPSGLFSTDNSENDRERILIADRTFTFQVPKLAFLFPENAPFLGEWEVIDIGLSKEKLQALESEEELLEEKEIAPWVRPRPKVSHKGHYGHVLFAGGSYGKMGAPLMSGRACLRTGAGLLTLRIPRCGNPVVQSALPEAMCSMDDEEELLSQGMIEGGFDAIGVGPGIGTAEPTERMLKHLIQNCSVPMVLDADALNILAENPTWLSFLPNGCILTPHPGEFKRLVGQWDGDFERHQLQKDFARKYGVQLVLKGAHTAIASPDGTVRFNNTGNPGMATGGSGDVLTGMIAALLGQGYAPDRAAVLGVWLHGLAGDLAMEEKGTHGMIAGDIIERIPDAYRWLERAEG